MRASGPLTAAAIDARYGELVAVRGSSLAVPPGGLLAVTGPESHPTSARPPAWP